MNSMKSIHELEQAIVQVLKGSGKEVTEAREEVKQEVKPQEKKYKTETGTAKVTDTHVHFNNSGYKQKFTHEEIHKMDNGGSVRGFERDRESEYHDRYNSVYSDGDEDHHLPNEAKKSISEDVKENKLYSPELEEAMAAGAIHPMALHVKPVKSGGMQKYQVHAVGKKLGGGIKVGEHLSDSELDDASEMGAKIKHMKEDAEQVDEVSKKTLGNYVYKAALDMNLKGGASALAARDDEEEKMKQATNKAVKRHMGIAKAVSRMSSEETEQVEEMSSKMKMKLGLYNKKAKKEEVEEEVDVTVIEHKSFVVEIPESLNYQDYLKAAKSFTEDDSEIVTIADQFFKDKDESLVIEAFTRGDVEAKISAHTKAGHQVGLPKYTTKDGKPYAEYIVTNKDTGQKTKYIHHGTTRRVERM